MTFLFWTLAVVIAAVLLIDIFRARQRSAGTFVDALGDFDGESAYRNIYARDHNSPDARLLDEGDPELADVGAEGYPQYADYTETPPHAEHGQAHLLHEHDSDSSDGGNELEALFAAAQDAAHQSLHYGENGRIDLVPASPDAEWETSATGGDEELENLFERLTSEGPVDLASSEPAARAKEPVREPEEAPIAPEQDLFDLWEMNSIHLESGSVEPPQPAPPPTADIEAMLPKELHTRAPQPTAWEMAGWEPVSKTPDQTGPREAKGPLSGPPRLPKWEPKALPRFSAVPRPHVVPRPVPSAAPSTPVAPTTPTAAAPQPPVPPIAASSPLPPPAKAMPVAPSKATPIAAQAKVYPETRRSAPADLSGHPAPTMRPRAPTAEIPAVDLGLDRERQRALIQDLFRRRLEERREAVRQPAGAPGTPT